MGGARNPDTAVVHCDGWCSRNGSSVRRGSKFNNDGRDSANIRLTDRADIAEIGEVGAGGERGGGGDVKGDYDEGSGDRDVSDKREMKIYSIFPPRSLATQPRTNACCPSNVLDGWWVCRWR
jgi:hypothetical protein